MGFFLCKVGRLNSSLCGTNQQISLGLWPFLPPSRCHKVCRAPSYQLWAVITFEVWKKISSDSYTRHYKISIVQLHVSSSQFLYVLPAVFFFFFASPYSCLKHLWDLSESTKPFFLFFPILGADENWIIRLNICWRRKGVWHVCFPRNQL